MLVFLYNSNPNIDDYGGVIVLEDNVPTGCRFTFTLPEGEVTIDE